MKSSSLIAQPLIAVASVTFPVHAPCWKPAAAEEKAAFTGIRMETMCGEVVTEPPAHLWLGDCRSGFPSSMGCVWWVFCDDLWQGDAPFSDSCVRLPD